MALYEHTFIARQDVSPQQVDALVAEVSSLVREMGGDVKKTEYWGLKNLAFRIKKNRKGHYAHLALDAPPAAVHEMERRLKINEDILRFLTIRVDELPKEPSAILAKREERKRRDGDFGGGGRDRDRGERGGRDFGGRGRDRDDREGGGFGGGRGGRDFGGGRDDD
jgi:small subunit ribosomal protein S6